MRNNGKSNLKFVLGTTVAIIIGVALFFGLCRFTDWLGQNDNVAIAETVESNEILPEMVRVSEHKNDGWSYYVDKRTNYTYLVYEGHYKKAVTALFNPDGTPMTLDQLLNTAD
jgi:hypothetical protein